MLVSSLFERRLLFVSGKGGTGKTTISMALACAAARTQRKVLLVSIDRQESFSQVFGSPAVGTTPQLLEENIWGICITAESALLDFLKKHVKIKKIYQRLLDSQVFQYFYQAAPGLKEYLILGEIWELMRQTKRRQAVYDLIIIDSPATGHTIQFLRGPEHVLRLIVGPMRKYAEQIYQAIKDPEITAVVIVTLAAEMPVMEAIDLYQQLHHDLQVPLGALLVNALPGFDLQVPLEQLPPDWENQLRAALGAEAAQELAHILAREGRRYQRAAEYVTLLEQEIPLPMVRLPYHLVDQMGLSTVENLAEIILRNGT